MYMETRIIELLEMVECNGEWAEQWVTSVAEWCVAANDGYAYKLFTDADAGWLPESHVRQSALD